MNRQLSCPALTVQESTPRPCPSSNQAASTATSIPPCPTSARCTPISPTTGATSSSSAACTSSNSIAYPANSPLTSRPDWRLPNGKPGSDLDALRAHALTPFGTSIAICNCLYGVQLLFSEDMGAGFARAVNDWIAAEWLDKEPRLRASIVVPMQNAELAVEEINRVAPDRRFVQILLLVMHDHPLGKRHYWPIYAAAEKHGLPVGIHAGSAYRHPVTPLGWPTYYTEDYAAQAQAFQAALSSLVCEGVFTKFPELKVVLLEFRLHLAARASLAADQILARAAHGGAVGGPRAHRHRAQQRPAHHAAVRRAALARDVPAADGAHGIGRDAAVLHRLPALAVRRRRRAARGSVARPGAQDHDRQSARHVFATVSAGGSRSLGVSPTWARALSENGQRAAAPALR